MRKKRINLNPAFIKKFWWLSIPIVGILGGGAYLLFFKKTTITGGGKPTVPGQGQQAVPGQTPIIPIQVVTEPERLTYTGVTLTDIQASSVLSLITQSPPNLEAAYRGDNILTAVKNSAGNICQLQIQLAGLGKWPKPRNFDGNWSNLLDVALKTQAIIHTNSAIAALSYPNNIDWRKTFQSLTFTIHEPLPFPAATNEEWQAKESSMQSLENWKSMGFMTPGMIIGLQQALIAIDAIKYNTGYQFGIWVQEIDDKVQKYYNESDVKTRWAVKNPNLRYPGGPVTSGRNCSWVPADETSQKAGKRAIVINMQVYPCPVGGTSACMVIK